MKRENNYDLLRIICALSVIVIHVSIDFKNSIVDVNGSDYFFVVLLYNTLSRFAVPCFVMLSGAFLLANERNAEYGYFYKKTIKSIGIPTMIFSFIYLFFYLMQMMICITNNDEKITLLLKPLKMFIKGAPYYHMWYMYMIFGLYIMVPVIIRVKREIGEVIFRKISWLILLWTCLSGWTSSFEIEWSISKSICYIGYFVIGYLIRCSTIKKKNNITGIICICLGIGVELFLAIISYFYAQNGFFQDDMKNSLLGNFNPLVVIASILIFYGFSKMKVKGDFSKISAQTFNIYFIHAGVWQVGEAIFGKIGYKGDFRLIIPASILVVFIISLILAIIYSKIWNLIEKRVAVSERVCKLMKI